jgi:hypothetical protein
LIGGQDARAPPQAGRRRLYSYLLDNPAAAGDDDVAMCDWTTCDISQISEERFPVRCDECGCALTRLGDEGTCPKCGQPFTRRERLWQTYGPEAFAKDPPPTPQERHALWLSAFVHSVIIAAGFALAALVISLLFDRFNIWFFLGIWLAVVLVAEFFVPRSEDKEE